MFSRKPTNRSRQAALMIRRLSPRLHKDLPAMMVSAGTLQDRAGGMLLWGESATPAVVNVTENRTDRLARTGIFP